MVRGNHEDVGLNNRYGFAAELKHIFFNNDATAPGLVNLLNKLDEFYSTLPVVLYLGTMHHHVADVIQCCHGGIEIGFDPHQLLSDTHTHAGMVIRELKQQTNAQRLAIADLEQFKHYFHDQPVERTNGFMWNDFIVNSRIPFDLSSRDGQRGTIFDYGKSVTEALLKAWHNEKYAVHAIFRAHQHGDAEMRDRILNRDGLSHADDRGVGKLWIEDTLHKTTPGKLDGVAVVTFCVAPDTGYDYPIHAFGMFNIADWRLEVVRLNEN